MTQYNSLNLRLSNSQLNKFKSAIKNEIEVVLRLSSNMNCDNEINFPRKLLTDRQVWNLCKSFASHLSADIKLSKTRLPLIKNVIKPLAKSVLIRLGLTAAASAAGAGIHKKYWDLEIQL